MSFTRHVVSLWNSLPQGVVPRFCPPWALGLAAWGPALQRAPNVRQAGILLTHVGLPWGLLGCRRTDAGVAFPALQKNLLKALCKLDRYLASPLEYELVRDPRLTVSKRRFLDGDQLTLADCGLLPKLNIVNVRLDPPPWAPPTPTPKPLALTPVPFLCSPGGGSALPPAGHPEGAAQLVAIPGLCRGGQGVQVHLSQHGGDRPGLPGGGQAPQVERRSNVRVGPAVWPAAPLSPWPPPDPPPRSRRLLGRGRKGGCLPGFQSLQDWPRSAHCPRLAHSGCLWLAAPSAPWPRSLERERQATDGWRVGVSPCVPLNRQRRSRTWEGERGEGLVT